jgi:hypothetical protein
MTPIVDCLICTKVILVKILNKMVSLNVRLKDSMPILNRVIYGTCLLLIFGAAIGQNYPSKSVRVIVHYPPGGPTDIVARTVSQKLSDALGHPFIIDNRPGASGIIGLEIVVRAVPDGHTLLFGTSGSLSINPASGAVLPYNVLKDFAPISLVVINPQILAVHSAFPPNSVKELISYAKARPGQINYASVGVGSPNHLGAEMLNALGGVQLVHIPYKGTAPALTDLLSGQVSLMLNSMPTVIPYVKSGRLKGIAVGSAKRSAAMPDIPTVAESGIAGLAGFEYVTWYAMLAPANTPKAIINKLNAQINRLLKDPELAQSLAVQGSEPAPNSPEQMARYLQEDQQRWRKIIKGANIQF